MTTLHIVFWSLLMLQSLTPCVPLVLAMRSKLTLCTHRMCIIVTGVTWAGTLVVALMCDVSYAVAPEVIAVVMFALLAVFAPGGWHGKQYDNTHSPGSHC